MHGDGPTAPSSPAPTALAKPKAAGSWDLWLGLGLVAAVLLAYVPVWNAGFIWDDDVYVTQNPLLTASNGLGRIWFSLDSPSQYFPLTYTSFLIERHLWGLNPAGYHIVNLLLHAANVLLIWRLLRRLAVPGAWLGAALFALHPVQVESVAWITERKNVLSVFFSLLAVRAWLDFVEERPKPRLDPYWMAWFWHLLALFSKTTACTLPAWLMLVLWLKRRPLSRARWKQMVPFLISGLILGLVTIWWERYHQGTHGKDFHLGLLSRTLLASHALWFYLGKLMWPFHLAFSYPRWAIRPANPLSYVWPLAVFALAAFTWHFRRRFGRGLESAFLFYAAALSPMLGFVMLFTFRYTYVADHYQYAASIGPLALAAAGIASLPGALKMTSRTSVRTIGGTLLLALGLLTFQQSRVYQDSETLWRATLERNPDSPLAHLQLGKALALKNSKNEAMAHLRKASGLWAEAPDLTYDIGNLLLRQNWLPEAADCYRLTLRQQPNDLAAHINLGNALFQLGQVDAAIAEFRRALELQPRFTQAINNLGVVAWSLATSANPEIRNPSRAVVLAEEADHFAGGANAMVARTLARAYAETGRLGDAAAAARRGLDLATKEGTPSLVQSLSKELEFYQARASAPAPTQPILP